MTGDSRNNVASEPAVSFNEFSSEQEWPKGELFPRKWRQDSVHKQVQQKVVARGWGTKVAGFKLNSLRSQRVRQPVWSATENLHLLNSPIICAIVFSYSATILLRMRRIIVITNHFKPCKSPRQSYSMQFINLSPSINVCRVRRLGMWHFWQLLLLVI